MAPGRAPDPALQDPALPAALSRLRGAVAVKADSRPAGAHGARAFVAGAAAVRALRSAPSAPGAFPRDVTLGGEEALGRGRPAAQGAPPCKAASGWPPACLPVPRRQGGSGKAGRDRWTGATAGMHQTGLATGESTTASTTVADQAASSGSSGAWVRLSRGRRRCYLHPVDYVRQRVSDR